MENNNDFHWSYCFGVAQITLGVVTAIATLGSGSIICEALISEGISDMIFGVENLIKGHCNWRQYWDHKK